MTTEPKVGQIVYFDEIDYWVFGQIMQQHEGRERSYIVKVMDVELGEYYAQLDREQFKLLNPGDFEMACKLVFQILCLRKDLSKIENEILKILGEVLYVRESGDG
jgi:hypothetical protein